MNGRTTGRCLIAFLGMLLGLALWSGVGLAQEEVIKVGMTNSFSGALATSATQVWRGIMVWEDWVNDQGGIQVKDKNKKMKVKIVYYDDETSRDNLVRLYEKLATGDKVDFFMAPYGSGQTFVVASLSDKYKKIMIAHTGSSPNIYNQGYKYMIQAVAQSDEFGRPYIDVINKVDPNNKKLALVWEDHLFPKSVATLVKEQAQKLGFNIVFDDKFPSSAQDIAPILTRVKQIKPDHIYVLGNIEPQILALRQMAELKVSARSIGVLDNGMFYFKKALGPQVMDGIMGPVEWDMSQRYKNINLGMDNDTFQKYFKKRYPNEEFDNHTPMGVNAGLILQRAIETAGTLDTEKVRKAFCTMRPTTLIGPQAWDCEKGLMNRPQDGGLPTIVTQWRPDGSTVTVWPPEFGDLSKLRFPVNKFQ